MCLGLPATVVEVSDPATVQVEIGGRRRQVSIALLEGPPPAIGERLVVHAGLAVDRIDEAAAQEIEGILEGFGEEFALLGRGPEGADGGGPARPLDERAHEEVAP